MTGYTQIWSAKFAFALGLALAANQPADGRCLTWSSSKSGLEVCRPSGWYHRTMPSGALFLCSHPKGQCTGNGGGRPLRGHAVISLLPRSIIEGNKKPIALLEFARRVAAKEPSSQFAKVEAVKGLHSSIEYLLVKQAFTTVGLNEEPEDVYLYFARSGREMVEIALTFNRGDSRSGVYKKVAFDLMLSLRPQ